MHFTELYSLSLLIVSLPNMSFDTALYIFIENIRIGISNTRVAQKMNELATSSLVDPLHMSVMERTNTRSRSIVHQH